MDPQNIPLPQTPAEPAGPKPVSSKRVLISLIVFLLVAAVGIGVFVLNKSQTSKSQDTQITVEPTAVAASDESQAAQWKTYKNAKHNFSIDYPGDWTFREFPDSKDGAAFNPEDKPGYPDNSDSITVSAGQKLGNRRNDTFENYVKIAGTEIQNYNEIVSMEKITTEEGQTGYVTTWMVAPMTINGVPPTGKGSESLPITYYEMPGDRNMLVRITLEREDELVTYKKMISTLKFTDYNPAISTSVSITPAVNEEAVLKTAILAAIKAKHGNVSSTMKITVSEINGDYGKGGANDEGGGGMWFAAKVNGSWKLVWDGNGVIFCTDLEDYPDFPSSMIPGCYDEKTQEVVTR